MASRYGIRIVLLVVLSAFVAACVPVESSIKSIRSADEPIVTETDTSLPSVEEFIKGSDIGSGFDLTMGSDGNLYIATLDDRDIVVLDPDTGDIIRRHGTSEGIDMPIAAALGTDGEIYWLNAAIGQVGRLLPNGEFDERVLGRGISAMRVGPDGRLLVARSFAGRNELYALQPDLSDLQFVRRIDPVSGFDIGQDGMLYGAVYHSGEIKRYDLENTDNVAEVVAEGLSYPTDVAFDNQGQLYAVASLDPKTNAIFQIDPENGSHTVVAEHPTGLRALAFDDENRMFVSDIVNATVYEVMADGTLHALRPGGFSAVGGLAVLPREDGGESLFATDLWGGLREFDTETGEQVSHVPNSPYPGSPVPALVLGKIDGRLVLGSSKSGEVQIWDPQAQHEVARAFIGYSGDIVAYEGDLVIPSAFGVFRVDPANPSEQETISHFVAPTVGVAVIGNDLYVAGVSDGRLMQIAEEGEMLQERRLVVQDLERAEGMAFAPDGRLLVVESAAGRLSAVDVMTGEVETIVEGLEFVQPQETIEYEYPFYLMNDVAVDSNGNIYISGDGANVIYKITLPGNSWP